MTKQSRLPTGIREVAQLAGVSIGTVSNVLNRPEVVAERTRRRVQDAIDRLNFVPNRGAADLRSGRSRMIGLVVPDITNPFFAEVARGAVDAAGESNVAVVLCNSDQDPAKEDRYLDVLEEHRVAGVVINPLAAIPDRLAALRDRGSRVVCVHRSVRTSEFCSVAVDDVEGGRIATEHLLSLGARSVALVNGPVSLRPCADRRRGARQAIKAAGLPADALTEVTAASMTINDGVEAAGQLLKGPALPDAVFCTNDLLAIGVTRRLTRAGIAVPGDVPVAGYDDIDLAAEATIPLTSVGQPKYGLGYRAAQLVLAEIAEDEGHRHERVVFHPQLTVRDSSRR
ncbi:LacI family DNA-binding transcriptional regulator [Jiangella asiatica]|uniref:LacI family transcriptional regulator n=1 Tax=Jiangella asiatica TaxID=2530372 RepID=A0A4R5DWZ7_9ACTN|nr:LacI family DNA-binding transcriptional regulator [Jiangella asiatica]TDE15835.1 LacI family transcriptional regulator [Jiangella asiatica]